MSSLTGLRNFFCALVPSTNVLRYCYSVPPGLFKQSLKTKRRIKLQARRRTIERSRRRVAEDAEQSVGTLVDNTDDREDDARINRVVENQTVHARVRLLREV